MAEEKSIEPIVEEAPHHAPPDLLLFGKWSTRTQEIPQV